MKHLLNVVYVTTQNTWLSKDGEAVSISIDREIKTKFPIHNIGCITCFGQVGMSPQLMAFCAERGVSVVFLSLYGKFLARIAGPVNGNVLLRRQQYRIADHNQHTSQIAKTVLLAKIANSRQVLLRSAREETNPYSRQLSEAAQKLAGIVTTLQKTDDLDKLRGYEGEAAKHYFDAFDHLILNQKNHFQFKNRNRRPPTDNINAMMSFMYSLLSNEITWALETVGLDPAVGYLHKDRPGRPSLSLDLMEEFRSWLIDRLILTLINRKEIKHQNFIKTESGAVNIDDQTRKHLLTAWQKRKTDQLTHPFIGEKVPIGILFHIQAQLLARHIRGDLDAYPPFIWK